MYKIISTTDSKYIGIELEDISNPIAITEGFSFVYTNKLEVDGDITLSNSNYIICLTTINK